MTSKYTRLKTKTRQQSAEEQEEQEQVYNQWTIAWVNIPASCDDTRADPLDITDTSLSC